LRPFFDVLLLAALVVTVGFILVVQTPSSSSPKPETTACPTCNGNLKIKCDACGGFGSIDQKTSVPCDQCGGTGKYQKKLHKGTVTCPFCGGKGLLEKTARVPCSKCNGLGCLLCPACNGTGKVPEVKQDVGLLDSTVQKIKSWLK
jgi:DnaJ-class molecular chaperone